MKTALSIAGSDSSAGAGIQADIKAMTMNGVYATTAITALTAQNTTGVRAIMEVTPQFLAQQIDAVFEDIRPMLSKSGWFPPPSWCAPLRSAYTFIMRKISSSTRSLLRPAVRSLPVPKRSACSKAFFCLWRR